MKLRFIAVPVAISVTLSSMALAQCAIWSAPQNVSQIADRFNVDGNLAVDASGNVHLVYQSFQSPHGDNYYITNQGGSWSPRFDLGSMNDKGSAPKIVITPDNQLHVFFGRDNLYWRTKPVTGGSWSAPIEVAINPTGGNFIEAITVDSDGGIYFVWGHLFDSSAPARNGIYGRYKPLGGAWQSTELIHGNGSDGNWPLASDVYAVGTTLWIGITSTGDKDLYYKKKPASGAWPAGFGTLLVSDAYGLTFAKNPTNAEFAALYHKDTGCGSNCATSPYFEVFALYTTNDGANWSTPDDISQNRNDIDRTPSAVYDSNGNFHVVWEGFCCDNKLRMQYRSRIGGVWGSRFQFTNLTGGHIPHSLQAQGLNLYMTFTNTGNDPSIIGSYDQMFSRYLVGLTNMTLNKTSLTRTITARISPSNDTFTVTNGCSGTLSYSITKDAAWLNVSPDSGTSTTDVDTITVSYPDVSSLVAGNYSATITVSGNGWNSPKTIPVQLKVQTVTPDFDGDGDVDQIDFAHLQKCLTGPNNPTSDPNCDNAQLDGDLDVDGADVDAFLACFSGPDVTANMSCAPLYP